MIVAMQDTATEEQIQHVIEHLVRMGFSVHRTTGERQTVLAAVGARIDFDIRNLEVLNGVQQVHRISEPYKLAGRGFRPDGTVIEFSNGLKIGADEVVVMAGPCSVESREQLFTVAELISKAGARVLRGGAFKPRSSPYSFQGMGEQGLKLLREAGDRFNMLVISEVMEISQIPLMLPYVDILQVGARNMLNFKARLCWRDRALSVARKLHGYSPDHNHRNRLDWRLVRIGFEETSLPGTHCGLRPRVGPQTCAKTRRHRCGRGQSAESRSRQSDCSAGHPCRRDYRVDRAFGPDAFTTNVAYRRW